MLLTLDPEPVTGGHLAAALTADEVRSHSLLYGCLEAMFGEKLTHRLCAQAGYMPLLTAKDGSGGAGPLPVPLPGKGAPNDDILLKFLTQEGFKSTRPQPPFTLLKQRGPGRLFGGRELFRIAVRWNKAPVPVNVLDVLENTGAFCSRGSGVAKRGMVQSLNRRSKIVKTTVLGVSSCWL